MTETLLRFEDFTPGRTFFGGPYRVTKEEIVAFAGEFDPQPHHLDEEAGKKSILGGLAASGWHVCSMTMRMFADTMMRKMVNRGGPGCDKCRWIKPVHPGDVLMLEAEVIEAKTSSSRPEIGFVKFVWRVFNQRGQVAEMIVTTMPARK